jgi:predicted TIM-barrel fold metal-dependent hydrolase
MPTTAVTNNTTQTRSAEIRARLGHPVIDGDGHLCEHLPTFFDYLKNVAGAKLAQDYAEARQMVSWYGLSPEERIRKRAFRPSWWTLPARNTLDRATAMMPALLRERMDEFGLDFAVIYSTMGIALMREEVDEFRQAATRALNRMLMDLMRDQSDRMTPVAAIPMHTPDEAVAELDHAVAELGMKAVMVSSNIRRPVNQGMRDANGQPLDGSWVDPIALDSAHNYDSVWAKCVELKVAPTSHSASMGWDSRLSVNNYTYNHTGSFAAAGEAFCKALVLGGVTRRFPELNFAFLECGVAWACELYAGLVGHCAKRNRTAIQNYNPAEVDTALLEELAAKYGAGLRLSAGADGGTDLGSPLMGGYAEEDPALVDEFAACGAEHAEDLRPLFEPNLYFGCEADDRLAALAFDTAKNPFGARLNAMFSSDLGHWDVVDMKEVLEEAYELCEEGLLSEADFRDFTFTNPAMLHARVNPQFFAGTVVEDEVDKLLADR